MHFTGTKSALDSAVVEVQEMFSSHGGHLTNAMYHHGTHSKLYKFSLNTGEVPADWKNTFIVQVFKKGESNYRPVSLTSVAANCLNIVHSSVMRHTSDHVVQWWSAFYVVGGRNNYN